MKDCCLDARYAVIHQKPSLQLFYRAIHNRFLDTIARSNVDGLVIEIGAGNNFSKQTIPHIYTTDILPDKTLDIQINAQSMPFGDSTLKAVFMFNVLHHLSDPAAFFKEIQRCLASGGRLLIVDQYPGWPARWIYRFLHHEPYDSRAQQWYTPDITPMSGANGTLPWIIFMRDKQTFLQSYPSLSIEHITPHTPLCYWLIGGMRRYCLLPASCFSVAMMLNHILIKIWKGFGSFMDIELIKT